MEGYYYGYPSRNYSFYPYSNPNPNRYMNPYHNSNPNPNPNPFLDPYYNSTSQPNQFRNPYHNRNPNSHHNPNPTPEPRVVSIPVRFVNSDSDSDSAATQPPVREVLRRPSPETAAVKLQKVVRGFLVRKNWRIVRKIEAEAEAIGEEIARDERVLEKEVKARIRVGEMLMNLLFRLDSVRGVRDYRKKVIRKVISLQELVDSIGARGDKVQSDTAEVERTDNVVDQNPSSVEREENKVVESLDSLKEARVDTTNLIDTNEGTEQECCSRLEENTETEAVDSTNQYPIEEIRQTEKLREKPNANEEFSETQEPDEACDRTEETQFDESFERLKLVDQAPKSSLVAASNNENNGTEMKGVRDVMERVVAESERMKGLMEELCKSSARQWWLMEGLVNRVQRLEKEVEKMERKDKKKRKGHGRKCDSCSKKCDNL